MSAGSKETEARAREEKGKEAKVRHKDKEKGILLLAEYMVPYLARWEGFRPRGLQPMWKGEGDNDTDGGVPQAGGAEEPQFSEELKTLLKVKSNKTIQDYLGEMTGDKKIENGKKRRKVKPEQKQEIIAALSYRINQRKAGFPKEYRQALSISLSAMRGTRTPTPRLFVDELIARVNATKSGNLYLLDGILMFGSPWDIFLSIVCKEGEDDVTDYETEHLADYPFITRIETWPVSYTHRWQHDGRKTA